MKLSKLHGMPEQLILTEGIMSGILRAAKFLGLTAASIIGSLGKLATKFLIEMGKDPSEAFKSVTLDAKKEYYKNKIDKNKFDATKEAMEEATKAASDKELGKIYQKFFSTALAILQEKHKDWDRIKIITMSHNAAIIELKKYIEIKQNEETNDGLDSNELDPDEINIDELGELGEDEMSSMEIEEAYSGIKNIGTLFN